LADSADPIDPVIGFALPMPVDVFERKLRFANSSEAVKSNSVIVLIGDYLAEFLIQFRQQLSPPLEMGISFIRNDEFDFVRRPTVVGLNFLDMS
jgi:hypothetical protein